MMTDDEVRPVSLWQAMKNSAGTERDRRNQYWFTAWMIVWALSYVGAHRMLTSGADFDSPMIWILVGAPNLFAIVTVFAYMRFLRMADELLRKIQLEGLAMGFAIGLVFITGYQLAEAAGVAELQTDNIVLVMIFSWLAGQFRGLWRYR